MNEDRLTELEIKYAHQEHAVERLEKTVFDQHRAIEDLAKQIKRLNEKFDGPGSSDAGPGDQKPPHY